MLLLSTSLQILQDYFHRLAHCLLYCLPLSLPHYLLHCLPYCLLHCLFLLLSSLLFVFLIVFLILCCLTRKGRALPQTPTRDNHYSVCISMVLYRLFARKQANNSCDIRLYVICACICGIHFSNKKTHRR